MATCPSCKTRYPNEVKTCEVDGQGLLPDEAFGGVEPDLPAGQKVGEYQLEQKIGEGGFGSVYRAVHPLIGKTAAVKVLNRQYSSNPQMVSRFIAEARAVNQIRNRNIIDIFSFGNLEDGRAYYVMELLEGQTLDRYLRDKGKLRPEEAIPILRGVARALDAAHAAGIAHRDLKPENIFLQFEDDGSVFPKLLDFGIAKLLGDSSQAAHKTRTGTPLGTPHYMSPEQCRGKNVDHRTDVYSFGIVAHEVLTGQLPFNGDDVMEILVKQTSAAPPRLSSTGLPAELDPPLLQMLEKDPAQRPTSILTALEDLAAAAQAAGFAVQVSSRTPRKSGGQPQVPSSGSKGLTPSEMGALAEARTLVQDEPKQTLMAAATEVSPGSRKRVALYAMGAIACILGVGVGVTLTRTRGEPRDVASAPATPPPPPEERRGPPPAAPSEPPSPTTAAPDAPAVATAAESAEVEIAVDAKPDGTEVFLDGTKLGDVPGPIKLKRGEAPVKLTFRAKGYQPLDKEVSPAADQRLKVSLTKVQAAAPASPAPRRAGRSDLEF